MLKFNGGRRIKSTLRIKREVLQTLYLQKKLSIAKIAHHLRVHPSVIRRLLKEFGIQIRSRSKAAYFGRTNHVELTDELRSFLVGELLGDGHLQSQSVLSARFTGTSKYRKYAEWLSETFANSGIQQAGKISKRFSPNLCFQYHSRSYAELKPIHDTFYKDRKKIIPVSLEFDPLIVRQWYLGDGSLAHQPGERGRPGIRFATDGFTENEVGFLVDQFKSLGFLAKKQRKVKVHIITMSVYSTAKFLDYIGPCPSEIEEIYGYKWKFRKFSEAQSNLNLER